jgi:hypothetical protein
MNSNEIKSISFEAEREIGREREREREKERESEGGIQIDY